MPSYTTDFYNEIKDGSRRSAERVVPLVMDLLHPERVVDVGCGVGTWLAVFQAHGVGEILGIDGSWVNQSELHIPPECFRSCDLTSPLPLEERFDLVVSLEVAEHLPEQFAEAFVDNLTRLGPVVLFSAAIPYQGGTHHVNEQWPAYWAKYFAARGYVAVDCLREQIWDDDTVEWWYAQNILLFVARAHLERHLKRKTALSPVTSTPRSLVHPRRYLEAMQQLSAEQRKDVPDDWKKGRALFHKDCLTEARASFWLVLRRTPLHWRLEAKLLTAPGPSGLSKTWKLLIAPPADGPPRGRSEPM